MEFLLIHSDQDLTAIVKVLNESHATVAKEFGFSKDNNPSNNAFIDEPTLKSQLNKGIELYALSVNKKTVGCVAIEKSVKEKDTFYIEKVSVLPEYRNQGYGVLLMNFATTKIKGLGGRTISIALIDSHSKLKKWYAAQGFVQTGTKDFERLPFRVCFMSRQI